MNDAQILETAELFLKKSNIAYLSPGEIGEREGRKVEVIFMNPFTIDPEVATVDPPDIRVWVDIYNGTVDLIPQM